MATITKDANTLKLVLGWYGECGGDECLDLDLGQTLRNDLQTVYQFTPEGGARAWSSALPPTFNQRIMKLKCGNLYYLLVKSGTGSFTIPNFVVSTYDSGDLGRITSSCVSTPIVESTPTPTPANCECIPSTHSTVKQIQNMGIQPFSTDDGVSGTFTFVLDTEIGINLDDLKPNSQPNPTNFTFTKPDGTSLTGVIGIKGDLNTEETIIYIKPGDESVCYIAKFTDLSEQATIQLQLAELPPECVETQTPTQTQTPTPTPKQTPTPTPKQTPTPTPKQTPTPTPKQTPTPTPTPAPQQETSTQECCPSSRTKINAVGMPTGDQFADTVKITHDLGDKNVVLAELLTSNDQVGGVFCVDLTLTPNWTDNDTELPSLIYLEDTSGSPIGTFKKQLLNNLNEVSYQDPQNNCYVGTYEGAGANLVLTKTNALISDEDSSPEQTPTPTPKQTPTPTPKQTPTPTPKQTPTPTPKQTPTPTPIPAPDKLQFRWKTTTVTGYGEREVLQVKNILKPTNSTFGNRDTENNWSTLYAFTANPGSYSLNHQSWPDAAVSVTYDSEHGDEVKIDALTIGFGSVEGSGDGAYKQLTASHEANEKTIEFSTDSDYTIPAPLFIYIGDGNNETAVGVNSFWPVIMKALESTPTPKENTPTPKPECTCAPEGLETVVAQTSAIFMHDGFHSFGTFQPGTVISYDKSTFKTEGITSQVMFKFPDGSNAGIMMFGNSQKPDNTKFYFKVGNKCYSATAQSSSVSIWQLTLSLDSTLPDACIEDTDDEDSFADSGSVDCCDNNLVLPVIAGQSKVPETDEIAYYGVQARAIDKTGNMDGQLCWEEPQGELQFEMMKAYIVEFQDFSTNENQQLLIETTTPTTDIVFKYKFRNGQCYEGVLSETLDSGNVNTFNLV